VREEVGPAVGEFATAVVQWKLDCKLLEQKVPWLVVGSMRQAVPEISDGSKPIDRKAQEPAASGFVESDIGFLTFADGSDADNLPTA
jgi:hypothetical protein